jgi:hypothetical protein
MREMISWRFSLRLTRWKARSEGLRAKLSRFLMIRETRSVCVSIFQDLGEMDVGDLLLEYLDVARDARQRRVDLVGHSGREQPDGGQLLGGDKLLLEVDLVRDVLEDDDRAVRIEAIVQEGSLGDVEDPPVARGQVEGDLAHEMKILLGVGRVDGGEILGPQDPEQGLAEDVLLFLGERLFEDPVPADDPAFLIEDGHPDGQALDDILAVVLQPLELLGAEAGLII